METIFFNQIAMMNVVGTLQMTVKQGQNEQYMYRYYYKTTNVATLPKMVFLPLF